MKIRFNNVEFTVPDNAPVYFEAADGVEAVEMDADDMMEVLLAAVRKPAEKLGDASEIAYGRIWKMLDPDGQLSDHIGPGWVKDIAERMVKAGVLK